MTDEQIRITPGRRVQSRVIQCAVSPARGDNAVFIAAGLPLLLWRITRTGADRLAGPRPTPCTHRCSHHRRPAIPDCRTSAPARFAPPAAGTRRRCTNAHDDAYQRLRIHTHPVTGSYPSPAGAIAAVSCAGGAALILPRTAQLLNSPADTSASRFALLPPRTSAAATAPPTCVACTETPPDTPDRAAGDFAASYAPPAH